MTFVVPGGIDRTTLGLGALDLLAVAFDVSVTSNPADQPASPTELRLDLVDGHAFPRELRRMGMAQPVEVHPLVDPGSSAQPRHEGPYVAVL